ncbi:P1 family peptidase [Corynebacterium gerontici]|uniref:Peptidase family S58 n=1 Tax=Corynebacterium gerontici TaxID=2079234 RepID=A0A3G6J274_9CORY|nr:P1 family peptidase [Corynebacterium gerontici]AZA11996.1 Peptidase family S58 [Corynebacterium gerontici]
MSLSTIPGISIGHASMESSGCTVVLARDAAVAAVDVRGGGPGTRETDLLKAHNTVERVQAICLCGGSAYGLAAADGAMRELEAQGIGFAVLGPEREGPIVPIVPGAVIFDLLVGDPACRPGAAEGAAATLKALSGKPEHRAHSNVGAGVAATAGKLRGGFGEAALQVGRWRIAAGVVANPVGHVVDPASGKLYGDPTAPGIDPGQYAQLEGLESKLNTTIGVIATDAPVTQAQAKRLAMVGHDGLARGVQPAHSPLDGDTLFSLSTGDASGVSTQELQQLCIAAADVVQAAIVDAVRRARPGFGLPAYESLRLEAL